MGYPLVLIGLLMVITGGRGTYAQFGKQIASEFQGPNNFAYWLLALGVIGALGYIQTLQTISRYMMALVLLSIFLSHKGFFAQFQAAMKAGPAAPNALPSSSSAAPTAGIGSANPNTSGLFGQAPTSTGQATANSYLNRFFGIGSGATQ